MRHILLLGGALLALVSFAPPAAAAGPTKSQCISASEDGQDLEHAGKLREARSKLALCVAASCPGVLREDCAQKLGDVVKRIPSVVFAAKDESGQDLTEVRVSVDGAALLDQLDGTAVEIDPGEHRFTFEAEGLPKVGKTLVLREGEKGRREVVVLKSARAHPAVGVDAGESGGARAESPPASHPADREPRSDASSGDGQRTFGWIVAGLGLAGLGVGSTLGVIARSTYEHAVQTECKGGDPKNCSGQGTQDGNTAHTQAMMSTVAFVAGGVALATGAVLILTAPKAGVSVGANVGPGAAGLEVVGSW
jgi:hypothetical protein